MVPIKEALTFDDVTLAPKYSEILPSEVNTSVNLTKSSQREKNILKKLRFLNQNLAEKIQKKVL